MEVVHESGGSGSSRSLKNQNSDHLSRLPAAPRWFTPEDRKYYKELGQDLIDAGVLKKTHLMTLRMLATNCAQWEYAARAIAKKNRKDPGSGYVQTYNSGATNITTELSIKREAEKAMRQNIEAFGMDPQSEKKLKSKVDPDQGDLFDGFRQKHGMAN